MLFITQESFKETFSFNKNCDLSGSFNPLINKFFPLKLKIRKLKNYQTIDAKVKFNIIFTDKTLLKSTIKEAKLRGKKQNDFGLEYTVAIDPLNSKKFVSERLGGELKIKGKPTIKL